MSLAVLAAVLLVQLVAPQVWNQHGWVVLVAGLLIGLPHGAVDHLVPAHLLRESAPRLLLVIAGYAATAVAAWAVFRSVPAIALGVFVALSVLHFGTGEVVFDDERAGSRLHRFPLRDPVAVLATGGAALLLPVLREPATSAPLIALLVPGSSGLLPSWLSTGGVVLVLAAVAVTLVHRLRRRRWLAAGEVALLAAVGLLVAPLAAFGAYFGAWHALRHIARMVAEDPGNAADLAAGRLARPVARFAVGAAVPTVASLAALAGSWALAGGWRGFVTANLALLAGLTVPHVLVVVWWDRRRAAAAGDLTARPGKVG
ncbi:Brp/Blh family beta-carotene 15,15'-dioxygenase [Kineococcus sp. SYSU DK006]|uniref:Brp/Blh family beta-carotene 15,15'-dioxygenase n=1 Tax=Kineococcus sp. SYSU DK006 TaxID=3383127 RepID=UPI003D7EC240